MVAALAAPIVGALGGGALATAGVNLALYAGVSAASILLQMSMAEEQKQEIGTKLSAVLGGAVNQSIHFGEKETAGSFIYKNVWGRSGKVPNAFLTRVYDLGDRPVEDYLDYLWGAGEKCNFDAGETDTVDGVNLGHPIPKFNSTGGHRLWAKIHTGDQTTADNYLVDKFGDDPHRPWTEDHIGRGRAYMIVTQKYDKKQPEGEIDVVPVLDRSRYYDWRSDSTNGGSGSQRYGNSGTYGVEPGNPVVIIYNIMRGIYYGDEWLYGGQKWPARRFDNDSWTAAANKCDTNVGNKGGGGSHKWARVGGEIDLSEEPWTVITRLLRACNGRIVESGGVFKIYVGGIGASVYDFTDDDVIVSEELTGRLFPMREEIANTINGTYVEPQNAGEAKAYKARSKQDYIDADGDVRKSTVDFEYVRENRQAQRMAAQALKENRRFRTFVVAFWTQARKIEPCDVLTWSSERYGFEDKEFIAGDVVLRDDGVAIVNLREADNADADWDPDEDEDEFETGVFEEIEAPTQTFAATVTSAAITDDDNTTNRRVAIRINALVDDDFVDCEALRVEVRKKNGDQKVIHRGRYRGFFDPDDADYGDLTFTDNSFLPGKQIQVRYKIDPESDRDTEWSNWASHTITLGDYRITDDDTTTNTPVSPSVPVITTGAADKDEDGKQEAFLQFDWTPGIVGSPARGWVLDVYRATSLGGTYSHWKYFYIEDGDVTTETIFPNTKYFYKGRVKARGFNGRAGSYSSLTSTGVQPTKRAYSLDPGGNLTIVFDAERKKHIIRIVNSYGGLSDLLDDNEFSHFVVTDRTSGEILKKGRDARFTRPNPPATSGYRVVPYDIYGRAGSGVNSPSSASGGSAGVADVDTVEISANAVTGPVVGVSSAGSSTSNTVQTVSGVVTSNVYKTLLLGSCRNATGGVLDVDITIGSKDYGTVRMADGGVWTGFSWEDPASSYTLTQTGGNNLNSRSLAAFPCKR